MLVSNTTINTTVKGMQGYKREEDLDRFDKAKKEHEQYKWLYKG